jgi:precorrin-3B C17-methyltransferase
MEGRNSGGRHETDPSCGLISVVGTGIGSVENMTPQSVKALADADVIIGYATYLDLIPELLAGKEVITSAMMQEVDRCKKSFTIAEAGKHVAIVSGGDPGIYAMAGLILEIAAKRNSKVKIDIIPGIAAVNGCAARLGAPLMHDFAAISLSDLLTPWEVITKRLDAAASADFVIALYNPKSKKRTEHIVEARKIFLSYRDKKTPVGIVTSASRENEVIRLTSLDKMLEEDINMQSTVIIGNSTTFCWNGYMITPRGYKDKYTLSKS